MFSLYLSWLFKVVKCFCKELFVTAGFCLLYLPCLCAQPIPLPWLMINDIVLKKSKLWGLKHVLNILMDTRSIYSIWPLLLKGLHKYSLKMCEPFWELKMENGIFGKIQMNRDTKWACIWTTTVNVFVKVIPVHNSKSKFCTGPFKNKKIQKFGEKFMCPFLWCP